MFVRTLKLIVHSYQTLEYKHVEVQFSQNKKRFQLPHLSQSLSEAWENTTKNILKKMLTSYLVWKAVRAYEPSDICRRSLGRSLIHDLRDIHAFYVKPRIRLCSNSLQLEYLIKI